MAGRFVAVLTLGMVFFAPAHAQSPAQAGGATELPPVLRQKQALLVNLLADSPAAQRIESSQNSVAKGHFARAKSLATEASAAANAGDFTQADKLLNESMWQIGRARQLVPDSMVRAIGLRVRYAQLQSSIESLLASYRRHALRLSVSEETQRALGGELAQVQALVDKAQDRANAEQTGDAVRGLERAEQVLMRALNRILGAVTLEYAQRFESQAEEYSFELERNRNYRALVPVALGELKPSPEARTLIDRYVEQNRLALLEAGKQAERGNYAAALNGLQSGTSVLQRALGAAGLVMPQEMKTE